MTEIEEGMALEIMKPASGFINAVLGPKIEKVKLWASEKDLEDRIDSVNLSKVMNDYLIKLSHRVSEITSIAFPRLKLDIFKAYEPLSLEIIGFDRNKKNQNLTIDSIINGDNKSLSIIDNAGMGKSTFSKYIVTRILFKSDRIPILYELRKINKTLSLPENLAKEFDFPGKAFDRPLFYKLLEMGKFYVIIDGFDEVPLDYQEELANQIHDLSIKGGENILLLTSRSQEALPDLVHGTSLRFMPFTITQATSLLRKYDSLAKLDIGDRLIAEIKNVPEKFIESPLLVSLLYRTFGTNNSIADRICTFYDEIYHALYKGHDLINKNGYGREKKSNLDFEDFRKVLRSLCYYMMLSRKSAFDNWSEAIKFIDKAASICSITPSSSSNFLDDLLVAVPLMQKDGSEYRFFHKTILEYFSAEYLVFDKSSSTLVKKIFESKLAPSFEKTFEFLSDINSSLFDSVITHHFANLTSKLKHPIEPKSQIFTTLIFTHSCKIGLWSAEEYSMDQEIDGRPIFDTFKTKTGHNSATWIDAEIDGRMYFVAMCYSERHQNLHPQAWQSITKSIHFDEKVNLEINTSSKELMGLIGINNWHEIDFEDIERLKNNKILLNLSLHTYRRSGPESTLRVLSKDKIDEIIKKSLKELDFDNEIETFL